MIDKIFDLCVEILIIMGKHLNMTYNEVNVWLFCVIWPIITLMLIIWVVVLKSKLSVFKKYLKRSSHD